MGLDLADVMVLTGALLLLAGVVWQWGAVALIGAGLFLIGSVLLGTAIDLLMGDDDGEPEARR